MEDNNERELMIKMREAIKSLWSEAFGYVCVNCTRTDGSSSSQASIFLIPDEILCNYAINVYLCAGNMDDGVKVCKMVRSKI